MTEDEIIECLREKAEIATRCIDRIIFEEAASTITRQREFIESLENKKDKDDEIIHCLPDSHWGW